MKICTCKHSNDDHVLGIGQCCNCLCDEFSVDDLATFFADYSECAANSSFPALVDLDAFEPQGKRIKNKGQN